MDLTTFDKQVTDAVEKLSESVVSIDSVMFAKDYRFGAVPLEGQGSGVIIEPRGYIVTNNHVIDGAAKVQVTLKDGRTFVGEVVGTDPATDVALIKIDAGNLPAAKFGDSERLKVGQIVLAIGNALGLPGAPTVSMGVISALGRPLPGIDFVLEGLIQTDAAINPGNSGGPLADIKGDVIAINTAMIPFAQGVGFAIPAHTVKGVIEQILQNGRVVRPWLGIAGIDLNPAISRKYNFSTNSGVLVVEVRRDSPAYEAGIRVGDIIVRLGDHKVQKMKDLLLGLSTVSIGGVLEVSLIRMGKEYDISVRLVESPPQATLRRRR